MAMSTGQAQINMTPMIDVLLVLIIIFMVIAPVKQTGLRALVIVITVRPDGTVRLNQEPVNIADLGQRLMLIFRTAPDHVAFVHGDKGLEFRAVAEVIDIAHGAGLTRVALITD